MINLSDDERVGIDLEIEQPPVEKVTDLEKALQISSFNEAATSSLSSSNSSNPKKEEIQATTNDNTVTTTTN